MKKDKKQLLVDILEIAKEGCASPLVLDVLLYAGKKLSKEYDADETITLIGLCLMDIKLPEALKEGKQKEHIKLSSLFAKEFLKSYEVSKIEFEKIINCIEAHHGEIPYNCIEAEICANADCYIFIHPAGVFAYSGLLAKRGRTFYEQINQLNNKLEEKHSILSLDKAKEDLEEYYDQYKQQFKTILEEYLKID